MATDKDLASSEVVGTQAAFQLFAGDAPVITEAEILDAGNLAKYTVVGKITATGKVVALAPAASDGSQLVYGVLAQPADASSADQNVPVFTAGFFNDAALVWPSHASLDTLLERKAAFRAASGGGLRLGTVRL